MKKSVGFILFISFTFMLFLFSCTNKSKENIITQRIQYDVDIVSPGADYPWYVQNIEGLAREKFIKNLMESVVNKKQTAYHSLTYDALSENNLQKLFHRIDTVVMQRSTPPYEFYDTIVQQNLEYKDIVKIRFLEEWKQGTKQEIQKEVLGICPIIKNFDTEGNFRGYQPLFWVFYNEHYPDNLKLATK